MGVPGSVTRREVRGVNLRIGALAVLVLVPVLSFFLSFSASAATPTRAAAGTVLVTNLNANTVSAIDTASHRVSVIRGSARQLNGPLGIAIAPDGATAYVTNSLSDTVTPIDLAASPTLGAPIRVGSGPVAIAITPDGEAAYVTNFNANTVTPLDLRTHPARPGAPIHVGLGPWSIAVSSNGRTVCVSNSESSTVSVIDTSSRQVTTVQVGNRPGAIAIAPNGATAYVANGDQVTPISLGAAPYQAETPIHIGDGPVGIAITPDGRTAFTANVDNTVTPIDLTTSPVTPEAPILVGTLSQPDGIAISPNGATAYAANASDNVTPIDLTTSPATPEAPIPVGTASFGIAIVPDLAPIARLTVTPAKAGRPTAFNASSSVSPNGMIARYAWNFGDGTTKVTTTPTTTHVYARAGSYVASVTLTSSNGTSLARTFTGQTVSNSGGVVARATRSLSISSALQLTPASGAPGRSVRLRDDTFNTTCRNVYVFFDNKLIAQARRTGSVVIDSALVVPGDATLGRHRIELSCATSAPWLISAQFVVVTTRNHLSEFSVAMPGPNELKRHLVSAGGISVLMLLITRIIAGGFPSEWLDLTYAENRERIRAPFRRRFPWLFRNHDRPRSPRSKFVESAVIFFGFVGAAGLINSFLIPTFGLNRTTLWLFLGQCVGVAVITLSTQLPMAISGIRARRSIHLQVLVGGMLIAVACVVASRALGLSPGYCYGLIAVLLIRPEHEEKEDGRLHAISSLVVLCVSIAAFFLTIPVFHSATASSPSPFVLVLDPALNVMFMAGFASLAFGMFPLPFLPGSRVVKWNQAAWLAISGVGLIGFIAVLLSPGSGSSSELHHVALVPLVVAFVSFALISLSFMAYFRYRPNPLAENGSAQIEAHADTAEIEASGEPVAQEWMPDEEG